MRLHAWAWVPQPVHGSGGVRVTVVESYPCHILCAGGRDTRERAARACVREDLPPVEPQIPDDADTCHMGGAPTDDAEHPDESLADGCPGAWYRSTFARSLEPYLPSAIGGAWVQSPRLADASDLIRDLVRVWIVHKARASSYVEEVAASA